MEKESFNDKYDEKLVSELISLRDDAILGYTKHEKDFIALENAYLNILSTQQRKSLKKRGKSSLTPNLIKPKVDKIIRDLVKAFFGNDELAVIQPESLLSETGVKVSEILKKELKEFGRDKNLYSAVRPLMRDCLVYGTGMVKLYWSSKENSVKFERCMLNNVFLDPYAPTANDINFLVHRVGNMTIAQIKKQYPKININWDDYANLTTVQNNDIGEYQRVEFYEIYRKKNDKWYVSTILSDNQIIRADKLLKDGLPFIIGTLDTQFVMLNEDVTPTRAYGSSFIAPLISLQNENTIKRNQQIDATDIQLNQRFITTKESGVREDDLISNRKKIVVDNIANIRELPIPRLNDSIFDIRQLSLEADEISGINKLSEGISTGRNKTATEVELLQMQGSSVIDDIARAFNENFFRPMIQRIVLLIYKYKESDNFVGKGIDRKQPLRQKIIINVGIGSINKLMQIENIDKATQTVMQSIQLFQQDENKMQEYMQILDDLNKEKLKLLGQDSIIENAQNIQDKLHEDVNQYEEMSR